MTIKEAKRILSGVCKLEFANEEHIEAVELARIANFILSSNRELRSSDVESMDMEEAREAQREIELELKERLK